MLSKVFRGQNLIWLMILLGQIHGYKSCIQKERSALFELKKYMISVAQEGKSNYVLPTWTNDTKSDCCRWDEVKCNRSSGRVTEISFGFMYIKENSLLNLSLLHPFEEVRGLDLYGNEFGGLFDAVEGYKSLRKLRNLEILDFSFNEFNSSIFPFLNSATSLTKLLLLMNNMDGPVPFKELRDLTNLKLLDMSWNRFNGSIPVKGSSLLVTELSLLKNLKALGLRGICKFKNLQELNLSYNKLVGHFPLCLTSLTGLRVLDLSSNQLTGTIPSSLGNLESLEYLSLFDNNFQGFFSLGSLANLSELRNIGRILPHLQYMNLAKNNFQGNLPASLGNIGQGLRSLESLLMLDISNNNLTGVIPHWIGELQQLYVLLLSNNSLEGEIPISLFNISFLKLLDLSANMLSGDIPPRINTRRSLLLLLQDNNFSKGISDTLLQNVSILDLRNNRLSGNIPEFISTQNINILLLGRNNFTGHIPHQVCGLSNIHLLDLADNGLSGSIPSCLSNISFGSRKEDDTSGDYDFSIGYGNGVTIFRSSLVHRGNNIGAYFQSLVVLDEFIMDYSTGVHTKIEFATKHRYDSYMGGNLLELCGLDLSQNEFSGEIPVELGGLLKLHALNLSHNYLTGEIPRSFSGLKTVESLDLSFNRLHGEIPPQLSELNNLGVFNVSYNNLSGFIPQGGHSITFDARSYFGNPFLCGKPSNKSCNSNNIQEPDNEVLEDDEDTIDMVSFYWSLTAAYVTILVVVLASISFDSPWSRAWFNMVDAFLVKVRICSGKSTLWC
ncbi:Leucine-rich repeat-containing protein [Hirschfeldia incana]|nr:Leucine-rich repeat-containing protein [Hirschfeldia incana]